MFLRQEFGDTPAARCIFFGCSIIVFFRVVLEGSAISQLEEGG